MTQETSMTPVFFLTLLLLPLLINSAHHDHLFILAGQSNMVGMGGVADNSSRWDGFVPTEATPDYNRIFRLDNGLNWEVAKEPLHKDIVFQNQNVGVGPALVFANTIKERLEGTIGLVPCAVGGSSVQIWQPGERFYNNMLARAVAAASSGNIRGFIWYQGETDSSDQGAAASYGEMVMQLFTGVRRDLNLPQLPIIQVAIGTGGNYMEEVRSFQMGIDMANYSWVDAKGLQVMPYYPIHLSTPAQVILGKMLAEEYLAKFLTPTLKSPAPVAIP